MYIATNTYELHILHPQYCATCFWIHVLGLPFAQLHIQSRIVHIVCVYCTCMYRPYVGEYVYACKWYTYKALSR